MTNLCSCDACLKTTKLLSSRKACGIARNYGLHSQIQQNDKHRCPSTAGRERKHGSEPQYRNNKKNISVRVEGYRIMAVVVSNENRMNFCLHHTITKHVWIQNIWVKTVTTHLVSSMIEIDRTTHQIFSSTKIALPFKSNALDALTLIRSKKRWELQSSVYSMWRLHGSNSKEEESPQNSCPDHKLRKCRYNRYGGGEGKDFWNCEQSEKDLHILFNKH